nr:hypothetical protein [Tanacetum cinerariifolium]
MYYPKFTKVIIDYFMTRKPSIPRRNRINWHYVRDDVLFSTIKVVLRHQTAQQYDAILLIELTTDDIRNSKAYKEYYAYATGEAAPKPKVNNLQEQQFLLNQHMLKEQKPNNSKLYSKGVDKRHTSLSNVVSVQMKELTKGRKESEGDKTGESDDGSGDDNDETVKAEEEADKLYRDVNINQGRGLQVTQNVEDSHVTLTLVHPDGPQES